MKITDKEKLELAKEIFTGSFSREITHGEMDCKFREYGFENLINEQSFSIKTQQLQALISIINMLEKKISDKE